MQRLTIRGLTALSTVLGAGLIFAGGATVFGSPDDTHRSTTAAAAPAVPPTSGGAEVLAAASPTPPSTVVPIDVPRTPDLVQQPTPQPQPSGPSAVEQAQAAEEGIPHSEETSDSAMRAREAVARGLAYLASQQHADGYWLNDIGYKLNYSYNVTQRMGRHPGVTSIACLAFMAGGHYPGRGRYGENVRRGLEFVLRCVSSDDESTGFITSDGSRMYSHAFATLFLAEVLGMSNLTAQDEERVRNALQRSVHLIIRSQNQLGAWRYAPNASDADMSICVCQLQALRAARNVGISIPGSTIRRAREYIQRSYVSNGAFLYQNDQRDGSRVSWTLTAAGVCALQQAGSYDYFEADGRRYSLANSIDYLKRMRPYTREMAMRRPIPPFGYFYGHYYAAQAVYQYSRQHPQEWPNWLDDIRFKFVRMQDTDGSWNDQIGRNYATAMVCLILQIHYEYLPIFQK